MVELLIAASVVLVLLGLSLGSALAGYGLLLGLGAVAAMVGLAVGVLVGIGYHSALYQTLGRRGLLPSGWWWRPTSFHPLLRAEERSVVMRWFYAGVGSVALSLGGCVLLLLGLLAL